MSEWASIESAPKDRRILLYYPDLGLSGPMMVFGKFDDDRFAKKPRPYWANDCERWLGKALCRECPPTMWMIPEPPKDGE